MATSTFFTSFKTGPGAKLEGYSGHIYLVPSGSAVNNLMPLSEDTGRPGQYFRENVPDGEYKVYVDLDKSGSPVEGDLYKIPGGNPYLVWHGENKVSLAITKNFNSDGSSKLDPVTTRIDSNGKIINGYFDNNTFTHPRGESEYGGEFYYSSNMSGVRGLGVFEQFPDGAVFKEILVPLKTDNNLAKISVKVYKTSGKIADGATLAGATLLKSFSFNGDQFNQASGGFQKLVMDSIVKLNPGEWLYVITGLSDGNTGSVSTPLWTAQAGETPLRMGVFFNATALDPFTNGQWNYGSAGYYQTSLKLFLGNASQAEINQLKGITGNIQDLLNNKLEPENDGLIRGAYIPGVQYIHPRGDGEYLGDNVYSSYGIGMYEQFQKKVVFKEIEIPVRGGINSAYEVKVGKIASKWGGNLTDLTIIKTFNFAAGTFNTSDKQFQRLIFDAPVVLEGGFYLYILVSLTSGADNATMPTWLSASSNPSRHEFLFANSSPASSATWSYSSLPNYCQSSFKLLLERSARVASDNSLPGVFIKTLQYMHPRGDAEYFGDTTYGATHGLGTAVKMNEDVIFDKMSWNIWASSDASVEARIYTSKTFSANIADLTQLAVLNYSAGEFNADSTKLHNFILSSPVKADKDSYIYVFCYRSTGTMTISKWTGLAGSYPERTGFLFTDSNPWGAAWNVGSSFYYGTPFKLSLVNNSEISDLNSRVTSLESSMADKITPRLILPKHINAAVGVELNLFFDAMVLGTDAGLNSAKEYSFVVSCDKGAVKERCYSYTPASGDVGTYSLNVSVYDSNHNLLDSKSTTLEVVAATAPSSVKNIVMIGDSLTAWGVITGTVQENFAALGSNTPVFRGFMGGAPSYHQGMGGWTFNSFATQGPSYWKFNVSGVGTVAIESCYSNNGSNFYVKEVNLTNGSGYIKCERSGSNAPLASGALTKVSGGGDASINYSAVVQEAGNPLWNPSTSRLDIAYYRNNLQMGSAKFDLVTIQLGINESFGTLKSEADRLQVIEYAKDIADAFLTDNAATKIIIMLPSTDGNTLGGWGANYGATAHKINYQRNIWRLRELILSTFDDGAYNANVFVGVAGLVCDRYYGYERTTQAVSARISSITEEVHVNAVHPKVSEGYQQMGDGIFPQALKLLQ